MVKGGHGKGARAIDDAGIAFNVTRRSRGKELAFQNGPISCQPARGKTLPRKIEGGNVLCWLSRSWLL